MSATAPTTAEAPTEYICPYQPDVIDIPDEMRCSSGLLKRAARNRPEFRAIGWRDFLLPVTPDVQDGDATLARLEKGDFSFYSYDQLAQMVVECSRGITAIGLKKEDKVGILSINRVEWNVVDMACDMLGIITVPLYDSQSLEEIEFIGNDSEITA
ncbi:hypothetical protein KIPB_009887, partial [Kipferlia bialata]|eukprot:g9887.t1